MFISERPEGIILLSCLSLLPVKDSFTLLFLLIFLTPLFENLDNILRMTQQIREAERWVHGSRVRLDDFFYRQIKSGTKFPHVCAHA